MSWMWLPDLSHLPPARFDQHCDVLFMSLQKTTLIKGIIHTRMDCLGRLCRERTR